MIALPAGPAAHARVHLPGGATLIEAATAALGARSVRSANLLILGGAMTHAFFHTSVLTPGGARWIDYGPAQAVPPPAWLVMGSATFGIGADGAPTIHCHAVLSGDGRLFGGHLAPDRCVLGAEGLIAHATWADSAGFVVRRDEASGFHLLTPECC